MNDEWKAARMLYYKLVMERLLKLESVRELNEKESNELDRIMILMNKELDAN